MLCGFGLSPVFPTVVALFTDGYGTGSAGTIVIGVCGIGAAIVPWLVGVTSIRVHSLRLGIAVNIVGIVLAIFFFWKMQAIHSSSRGRSAARASSPA
jgi:MFS transporter, FHS family, glucose/mannose:H+ symporter